MVGSRMLPLAAFVLLLSAWPASASLLEDATGEFVAYQFDGATTHDAPDTCARADARWSLPLGGSTDGLLVPPDDAADVFVIDVPPQQVGSRLALHLSEAVQGVDLAFDALVPGCGSDVFAPQNQPAPLPAPPAPQPGQAQVSLSGDALAADTCADDWFLMLTGAGAAAPQSLHAAWTDGSQGSIPLAHASPEVAVYRTARSTAFTLHGLWANVPATWTGELRVAHAPCGAVDGGAVFGAPAQAGDDLIGFTPIRAGPHVLVVTVAGAGTVPTAVPATCHMCLPQAEQAANELAYRLTASVVAVQ